VLGNIQNHIDGVGGPDNVHIVLVVHGPAINAFNDIEATEKVRNTLAKLKNEGWSWTCAATHSKASSSPWTSCCGFVEVPEGGVTKDRRASVAGLRLHPP